MFTWKQHSYSYVYEVKYMWQKKSFENKNVPNLSVEEVNYLLELFDKKQ